MIKSKEEEEETQTLYQQFTTLQRDWDAFKNSNTRRQYSTGSSNINGDFPSSMKNKSPKESMCSLHNKKYSPYIWKVRNDELAMDIVRERWEAIESGKLKGRRLFGDSVEREEIYSGGFDFVEELSEASSVGSRCCDDGDYKINYSCENEEEVATLICGDDDDNEKIGRETMAKNREKRYGKWGKWMDGLAWFGIGFFGLFIIGIVSIGFNGRYHVCENEVILVPT